MYDLLQLRSIALTLKDWGKFSQQVLEFFSESYVLNTTSSNLDPFWNYILSNLRWVYLIHYGLRLLKLLKIK